MPPDRPAADERARANHLPAGHGERRLPVARRARRALPATSIGTPVGGTAVDRWTRCADCHAETAWAPSSFGAERHAGSDFPLTGAHAVAPCTACHQERSAGSGRFTLALTGRACADCHTDDSPHGDSYAGIACESCHTTEAFEDATYDHALLEPGERCASCHDDDNPHGDQFADRDCSSCHVTDHFTIERFDHSTTRFPLDGAHSAAACAQCHVTEGSGDRQLVRYRPLGTECTDCHGGNDGR